VHIAAIALARVILLAKRPRVFAVNGEELMLKFYPLIALITSLLLFSCAGSYIHTKDFEQPYSFSVDESAKIERSDENLEILKLVQSYRNAIVDKDVEALKNMVAQDYYENASTTDDLLDDYGNERIDEILHDYLLGSVKDIRYIIVIKQVLKDGEEYKVDYQYIWNFRFEIAGQSYWNSKNDTNRIVVVKEDDAWKIKSGL
jgi:hypothetical protein